MFCITFGSLESTFYYTGQISRLFHDRMNQHYARFREDLWKYDGKHDQIFCYLLFRRVGIDQFVFMFFWPCEGRQRPPIEDAGISVNMSVGSVVQLHSCLAISAEMS